MSDRLTIILDQDDYAFLESKTNGDRRAYISNILKAEKHIIADKIFKANQEEAEESYQEELTDWDNNLNDGWREIWR